MNKHTSLAIALTATTFLSAPAVAASLTPTLDSLKSEAGSVLPTIAETYNLTELSGDLPEGAVKVEIGDKGYYFTPNGDHAGLLITLAGTSAGMLKESSDGLFELDGKKYGFDAASIPDSAFSYSEGTEDDYNFTVQEADAEGKLTTKYYKISLLQDKFSTAGNISWEKVSAKEADTIQVDLPNGETQYFKYTYTDDPNRTKYTSAQTKLTGDVDADFVRIKRGIRKGGAIENSATIGDISGNFVYNYAPNGAGAIYNEGTTGNVTGNFIGNYTGLARADQLGHGGAIYNYKNATMGNVSGNFIGNVAGQAPGSGRGGAVYNDRTATIGNVSGRFVSNSAMGSGGAINNEGTLGNVTADFVSNSSSMGGAIYNPGVIGDITGDFVANSTSGTMGGAIYNYNGGAGRVGTIGNITGNFIANSSQMKGGAIANEGIIGKIEGNFIGNSGAVYNGGMGTITEIVGNFINNSGKEDGGAIKNHNKVFNITGNFIANSAEKHGGAIFSDIGKTVGDIDGDFIGNSAKENGGAIYNQRNVTIGKISGSFINNSATVGGAVYTPVNMTFTSGSETHFMSGNYAKDPTRGKVYNAVYGSGTPVITFDTADGGAWVINDNVENGNYILTGDDTIDADTGTTTQYVAINNDIVNAGTVTVENTTLRFGAYEHEDQTAKNWYGKGAFVASLNEDGTANRDADAVTSLSLNNAVFDIANGYQDVVKLKGYSATDSFMHIDVDADNMSADMLNVNGNVEGVTKMIVHASSNADIRGKGEILFAQSENDTTGNEGSFVVSRVYKSPYLFDVKYDQIADNSNKWFFEMNDQDNPDKEVEPEEPDVPTPPTPDKPDIPDVPTPSVDYRKVAPEVIAYQGLPVAALEQTKGMVGNISRQVQGRRFYCPGCGFYDSYWNGQAFNSLWANAVYQTSENEALVNVDADVWGLEAGGDLQHDLNNKLGLFLSYRKGNYDMNGDGKHHYSTVGSEIDIDSYLAGLYYRYDRNHWWTFATVYGGIQRVDLKTKDGIKSDTDGTEFGGSVELGYDYALNKTVYLTPSVGAFYTQVDYDDATDSAGKVAKYNTLRQLELEAGVKLTKAFVMDEGYANLYVKPSVVRTITDGDEVRITGLGKVNTIDDQTLGRIELGGRYGFTEQLSAYGWANHTFGDDYKASTFGLGLSYSW